MRDLSVPCRRQRGAVQASFPSCVSHGNKLSTFMFATSVFELYTHLSHLNGDLATPAIANTKNMETGGTKLAGRRYYKERA